MNFLLKIKGMPSIPFSHTICANTLSKYSLVTAAIWSIFAHLMSKDSSVCITESIYDFAISVLPKIRFTSSL